MIGQTAAFLLVLTAFQGASWAEDNLSADLDYEQLVSSCIEALDRFNSGNVTAGHLTRGWSNVKTTMNSVGNMVTITFVQPPTSDSSFKGGPVHYPEISCSIDLLGKIVWLSSPESTGGKVREYIDFVEDPNGVSEKQFDTVVDAVRRGDDVSVYNRYYALHEDGKLELIRDETLKLDPKYYN